MQLHVAPAEPATQPDTIPPATTSLGGRWGVLVRGLSGALIVLTLGLFVVSLPDRFAAVGDDSVLDSVMLLVYAVVAAVIVWRKSNDWMVQLIALWLVSWGATLSPTTDMLIAQSRWSLPFVLTKSLGQGTFFFCLCLFPDGRFVPRWTRALPVAWILARVATQPLGPLPLSDTLGFGLWVVLLGSGVGAQIYRFRRVSDRAQRQQTKWIVFGLTVMSIGLVGAAVPSLFVPAWHTPGPQQALYDQVSGTISVAVLLFLPITLGIAILRSRLWDIDILLSRTLVYIGLSISVLGVYVLAVGYLSLLFQARESSLIALLATGVVAVLFQPLRDRLQRGVNRLLYGERDEPYAVLSRLSQRLEGVIVPTAALPTIVDTIAQALKLPYVAITLRRGDTSTTVAACGAPQQRLLHLPLTYQSEHVGDLLLAPRTPGEELTPADRRLLEDLARQTGVVVHAVRLADDLQQLTQDLKRAQVRLISTREEERRRLRRDLHDGLGSVLASLNLRAGAIRTLLVRDVAAADALVVEQQQTIRSAISDIRRLVHDLRPPALDELGLVGAIRERAAQCSSRSDTAREAGGVGGLTVLVRAPSELPVLPAAVEVAAYRIVQEALTNVVRHAQARSCSIEIDITDAGLEITVADDGIGVSSTAPAGVGLIAMRERASELGGSCEVQRAASGGTHVHARLPLLEG